MTAENVCVDDRPALEIDGASKGEFVVLRVTDTGDGIPLEIIDQVFDPFFTTKTEGQGTGLGLATVAGIVKRHGGFVKVESRIGTGTQFSVYLPALPAAPESVEQALQQKPPHGSGQLVLVIDDEAPLLELIRTILELNEYRVLTAPGGAEALRLYVEHQSDIALVLTDMAMPNMDGIATIDALRRINPDVKVVVVSGTWMTSKQLGQSGLAVNDRVDKPFTMDTLLRVVGRVIASTP